MKDATGHLPAATCVRKEEKGETQFCPNAHKHLRETYALGLHLLGQGDNTPAALCPCEL